MNFKVAFDSGPLKTGSAFRGIGVMVNEQINALHKYTNSKEKKITIDVFDFNSADGVKKLESGKYDLVHYTTFFPYARTLPAKKYAEHEVVTIHDLIHLVYPDKYPPGLRGSVNFLMQKARAHEMDAVITISETSKKDIVRFLGIQPDKIKVTYLAPSSLYKTITNKERLAKIRKKYGLPTKFVFNLGDVNYNKNIMTLVEACEIAGVPLVLGGKQAKEIDDLGLLSLMNLSGPKDWVRFLFDIPHPENAHYENLLDKFKKNKDIIRLGYIPNEDVASVFSLASVYVQPSYYEGFGFSVVHAFACNVPVVISKTNCLVEIAGKAALTADPHDPKDMANKIETVIKSKKMQKQLISLGKERLKYFSWEKNAKETVEVYKRLLV